MISKIIIYLGFLIILVNTLIGLLITKYGLFNWLAVDIAVAINIFFLFKISLSNINNGFKISFFFVNGTLLIASIIIALLSPSKIQNNYYLITFIFIMLIEGSLFLIAKNLQSLKNK